ncbi:MAG: trypsin-like peptidase domain-containing protein [Acidobacteria bacterium]|nr:trypsin-like peptidase domain-containing protein [Acidobacteriota bacterium]
MSRVALAVTGLTGAVSFLLGLVFASTRPPLPTTTLPVPARAGKIQPLTIVTRAEAPAVAPLVAAAAANAAPVAGVDFGAVAATLNATVVNVDTASRGLDERARPRGRYVPGEAMQPREGSGSGFIIDPAGFVLTNYHVVTGADRVTVTLSDGRPFKADLIGVDPALDIALLQIHTGDKLPAAPLGDSDALRVGEWVCAIGNPLGVYVHSVTVGVVSFLGRKLFDPGLDAFIQTDAAISFGNSGGPLINARGEVVGITTAVSAQASSIGFAIPITQVIAVLPQLHATGMVARGFLGVGLTTVTPELRRALRLAPSQGAVVQDVSPDSPPDAAGLRAYDVIVGVDGQVIRSDEDLIRYVSSRPPGTLAALDVWRDGQTRTVHVKLRDRPLPPAVQRRTPPDADIRPVVQDKTPLGMKVRELDEATAARLRIPDQIEGVLIAEVDPAGPAKLAQLKANQVVVELNRQRVGSVREYVSAVSHLTRGDVAALLIYDRNTRQHTIVTVTPDADR